MKTVITDWGHPLELVRGGRPALTIPRYGVWTWNPVKRRHEVAEVGDDLEALRARWGADLEVVLLGGKP